MSDKKILFQKLDLILRKMFRYSLILGSWGERVWVVIYLGYDRSGGYSAESYVVNPYEIHEYEHRGVYDQRYEYVYVSEYDLTNSTNNYNIYINKKVVTMENSEKIEKLVREIEILSIDAGYMAIDLYLNRLRSYPKLLIYSERTISNEHMILKEINESFIFGQSISDRRNKYREQPVFRFMALKGNKTNIYNGGIKLNFPDYYRFSFIIYG